MAKASSGLQMLPVLGPGIVGTTSLGQWFLFAKVQLLCVRGRMWWCCVWVIPTHPWTFPQTATNKNCNHYPNLSTAWCSHICSCVHVAPIYMVVLSMVLLCTRCMVLSMVLVYTWCMVHGPQCGGAPMSLHMKSARLLCGCSWRRCQENCSNFHMRWQSSPIRPATFPVSDPAASPRPPGLGAASQCLSFHAERVSCQIIAAWVSPSPGRVSTHPTAGGDCGSPAVLCCFASFLSGLSNRKEKYAV